MRPRSTTKNPSDISDAVRELRVAMKMTQEAFAAQLGMAVATIARYETSRTPKAKSLSTFAEVAKQNGREDLAKLFRKQLIEDVGAWIAEKMEAARTQTITPRALSQLRSHIANCLRMLRELSGPGKQAAIEELQQALELTIPERPLGPAHDSDRKPES